MNLPGSKAKTTPVQISITYAEHGTIIGEECFLNNDNYFYTTVVRSSQATVLELPKICLRELITNDILGDLSQWYKKSQ